MDAAFVAAATAVVGADFVRVDDASRLRYGTDALKRGQPADLVVIPGTTAEVAAIARLCDQAGVPLVPRGAGTGYTGGAVPVRGGVVVSLERFTRILSIDPRNLLVVVQPGVITGTLQDAVEDVGLFYPPDPASLRECSIGGNVAECAGGPRAFKYGNTRRYVLGLEAVLADGTVIRTGGKTVKNVVGYDLTQLLVGSEGTLAIVTEITLRLVPLPPARAALRATFATIAAAVDTVDRLVQRGVVPAALELVDRVSLEALCKYLGGEPLAPAGTEALLVIEVDGVDAAVAHEIALVEEACRASGATDVRRARDEAERQEVWRARRELSYALRTVGAWKYNHDIVVPKGRIPELFALVDRLRAESGLLIPGVRPRRRRQHPRQHHGRRQRSPTPTPAWPRRSRRCSRASSRSRDRSPASTASASEGEVPAARGVARDHRGDAARQAGLRSEGPAQPRQNLSWTDDSGVVAELEATYGWFETRTTVSSAR